MKHLRSSELALLHSVRKHTHKPHHTTGGSEADVDADDDDHYDRNCSYGSEGGKGSSARSFCRRRARGGEKLAAGPPDHVLLCSSARSCARTLSPQLDSLPVINTQFMNTTGLLS